MKTTTRQIANIAIDEQASIVRIFFSLFFFYNKPVTACIVAYLSNLFDYYFFFLNPFAKYDWSSHWNINFFSFFQRNSDLFRAQRKG